MKNTSKKVLTILVIVSLLISIGDLSRGMIRTNLLPGYATLQHKKMINEVTDSQLNAINDSLTPIITGFSQVVENGCVLDIAVDISTSIYRVKTFRSIPKVVTFKKDNNNTGAPSSSQVEQSVSKMKLAGWSGGVEKGYPSIINFYKNVKGFECHISIDFSALGNDYSCSKVYYFFGDPYKKL